MFSNVYAQCHTGVIHLTFFKGEKRIAAGSAFLVNRKLVTNHHVFWVPTADKIVVKTVRHDQNNPDDGFAFTWQSFRERIVDGSPEDQQDFAILDMPELLHSDLYSFQMGSRYPLGIGREYAILGYPLDHNNLTLHRGSISSLYTRSGINKIQLDASVNNGNSGGPLVELTDQGVVGIVTRKNTGLTNSFDALRTALRSNIELIQQATRGIHVIYGSGFDSNQALIENQRQIITICSEIERSANTGIAYAFSIDAVAGSAAWQQPPPQEPPPTAKPQQ
jgi:V8-like Glu-specific endopeptidase